MTRRGHWCVTGLLALGCLMPKAKLLDKTDGGGGVGGEAGAAAGRTGGGGAFGGRPAGGSTGGAQGGASGSGVTGGAGGTAPSAGTGGDAVTAGGTSGAGGSSTGGASAGEAGFGGEGGNDGGAGVVGVGGASGFAGGAGAGLGGSGVSAGETGQGGDDGGGGLAVGGAAGWAGMATGGVNTGGVNTGGAATGGAATGGAGTGGMPTGGSGACGPEGPSCAGGLTCGDGTSCCKSLVVESGSYERQPGETPSYPATVSSFCLDKYEVTVGRFRKFLAVYDQWHQTDGYPRQDDGEHPVVGAGSGWDSPWDTQLPTNATVFKDTSHLNSSSSYKTWRDTAEPATAERLPINYVSWYEAFAFCIWDGGRLPTEAEWQYAAQGGSLNRLYPWGDETPTSTRAVYDCMGDGISGCSYADILPVGSKPDGNGYWQQSDLAGSMWEWNLDWYAATYPSVCNNCANLETAAYRVDRGGSWYDSAGSLRATYRSDDTPAGRDSSIGLRCARTQK